jgi:hypothetical protein
LLRHLIINNSLPLAYLDKASNRDVFKFPSSWVCSKTMRKYIHQLVQLVQQKIESRLPRVFAVYFDGWSNRRLHFLGIVASFITGSTLEQRLISLSPLRSNRLEGDEEGPFQSLFSTENEEGNLELATSFSAETIKQNIEYVLKENYHRDFSHVTNLGGDNASVCHRVAMLARLFYDPCCNHLHSLEMNRFISCEPGMKKARNAVHKLMKVGLRPLVAAAIKNLVDLGVTILGLTRWSSNAAMLKRYYQLKESGAIEKIRDLDRAAPPESMREQMDFCDEVFQLQDFWCKALQVENKTDVSDPQMVNMARCWDVVQAAGASLEAESKDALRARCRNRTNIANTAAEDDDNDDDDDDDDDDGDGGDGNGGDNDDDDDNIPRGPYKCKYLSLDSDIVDKPPGNRAFLKGIYKIQKRQEAELTTEEKRAVAKFKIPVPTGVADGSDDDDDDNNDNLYRPGPLSPASATKKRRMEKIAAAEAATGFRIPQPSASDSSSYIDTRFVVGTNNKCERTFSQARQILTDYRASMNEENFENIIFLKLNEDLFDEHDVGEAIRRCKVIGSAATDL